MNTVFGIDFGTTNSLAATIGLDGRAVSLVDRDTGRPHPSVIWYRGSDVVVGAKARQNMDLTEAGVPAGFVRSPKMLLRREGSLFVDGRPIEPTDAVAEVLGHLKKDAALAREGNPGHDIAQAVFTIPVDFGGPERRALREAAKKAGLGVMQFVHEPVAALYAYLRSLPDFDRHLARLEGRSVLVFDWGGGTLDLTLCRIQGGSIMQLASRGDNEVGGDCFDVRLKNLLREKHARAYGIEDIIALEQPGMAAKLLHQCEIVKIHLSDPSKNSEDVIVKNYLKSKGPSRNLVASVTHDELDECSKDIVARGLSHIDAILEENRLTFRDIEICLATGGMVNMPAIRNGLTERFVARVPKLENGDRIIAEGAAWIAHNGLRLTLSKAIEILIADTSGRGIYYPLVDAGLKLPLENEVQNVENTRLFCTDPREGVAVVEVATPLKLGRAAPSEPRRTLCVATVKVDPKAEPLFERIKCRLQIDHDYVARIVLSSTARDDETEKEFHELEFGLSVGVGAPGTGAAGSGSANTRAKAVPPATGKRSAAGEASAGEASAGEASAGEASAGEAIACSGSNLVQRTNVACPHEKHESHDRLWRLVPGDLVERWRSSYLDTRRMTVTQRQRQESDFYRPCAICKRRISQIKAEGSVYECSGACGL